MKKETLRLRKIMNDFCGERNAKGLPCKDCPMNNNPVCYSEQLWKDDNTRKIKIRMRAAGVKY